MTTSSPNFLREARAMAEGARRVAGIDEAGRGPLAGPVAAAAVILDPRRPIDGLADSKTLTAQRRENLFEMILERAQVGIGLASAEEIDRLNIRVATFAAMRRALEGLGTTPCLALVDGKDGPILPCPVEMIVGGDGKSVSIAAASIVAKVTRDRLMEEVARLYPDYGFAGHKGYGTAAHRAALTALGPCPEHRRSFAPVRAAESSKETHGADVAMIPSIRT